MQFRRMFSAVAGRFVICVVQAAKRGLGGRVVLVESGFCVLRPVLLIGRMEQLSEEEPCFC